MEPKTKEKNEFINEIKNNTDKVIKTGLELTKIASKKIDESAKIGIEKAKSSSKLNELKIKTAKAAKTGMRKGKEIQEKSPSFLKKAGQKSLLGFEKFVGSIRRGTQYGKTSIEMLEQFAKMKELGIITEKEFEKKKKEILDRI